MAKRRCCPGAQSLVEQRGLGLRAVLGDLVGDEAVTKTTVLPCVAADIDSVLAAAGSTATSRLRVRHLRRWCGARSLPITGPANAEYGGSSGPSPPVVAMNGALPEQRGDTIHHHHHRRSADSRPADDSGFDTAYLRRPCERRL